MGGRDHALICDRCGGEYSGFNGPAVCPCRHGYGDSSDDRQSPDEIVALIDELDAREFNDLVQRIVRLSRCQGCGVLIENETNYRAKWCSGKCRRASYLIQGECIDCGREVVSDSQSRLPKRCSECSGKELKARHEAAHRERYERVAALWREGIPMRELADLEGTTVGTMGQLIHRLRKKGYDVPFRHEISDEGREAMRAAVVRRDAKKAAQNGG